MDNQPNPYEPPQSELWPVNQLRNLGLMFGDEPIATFQFIANDEWFKTGQARRGQTSGKPKASWPSILALTITFLTMPFGIYILFSESAWFLPIVVGLIAFIALIVVLYVWLQWYLLHVFRKSKSYNTLATAIVFRDGFVGQDRLSCSATRWEAFSSAVRFPDGFLLSAKSSIYWLPMGGLVAGGIEDIAIVLQGNIADYKVVPF